jgi:hypothetical protein
VKARIAERRDNAFLTREFLDLGGERQLLRALRELTKAGDLIRLGYGVYARAELSSLTQRAMLAGDGFGQISRDIDPLGVADLLKEGEVVGIIPILHDVQGRAAA